MRFGDEGDEMLVMEREEKGENEERRRTIYA